MPRQKWPDSTDSVTGEIIIHRLHYNDTCKCFVRDAEFTFTTSSRKTFTRERQDSIWLADSLGNSMTVFHPFQAAIITHHRHVIKVNGAMDIDVQINTYLAWTFENGIKTGAIWSGSLTGTFNGVPFKKATITNVKHLIALVGGFGFPVDGVLHMERGDFSIDITFTGSGMADVVITGKGKLHHIKCHGEDEAQED